MSRVHVRPSARTRQRRRRRRAITLLVYIVIVFGLAWFFESQGTTTVLFVRHADIDPTAAVTADTPLTAQGRARADRLADYLANIDVVASVDAIYVDETRRTQETAASLAKSAGVETEMANHDDVVGFMRQVLRDHKREIVLIVTQKDDIAPLVEELHGSKNIAEIAPDDYASVFIVSIPWFGKVKTLRVHYALMLAPPSGHGDLPATL
jgi:broad specificity phosphatase PhoE